MTYDEYAQLRAVGGRAITRDGQFASGPGDEAEWNFGLLRPDHPGIMQLTAAEADVDRMNHARIAPFTHTIPINDDIEAINLADLWRHPTVVQALGKPFTGFGQYTGSCVGAGGGNAEMTLCCAEVVLLGQPEKIYWPFWPLNYGRSRLYMGDPNRGEGSREATWAQACQDGVLNASAAGLPPFYEAEGSVQVGAAAEMAWSDGDSPPLTNYLDQSRQHPITGVSQCRSAQDVWDAIGELKPVGQGSMYGYNVTGVAPDGIKTGRRGPRWSHKQTILGRCVLNGVRHFLNVNQWFYQGAKILWIPEADVQWICGDGEVYAYHGLQGIPDDQLRWVDWSKLPV